MIKVAMYEGIGLCVTGKNKYVKVCEPTMWERLRGITLDDKIKKAVEKMQEYDKVIDKYNPKEFKNDKF